MASSTTPPVQQDEISTVASEAKHFPARRGWPLKRLAFGFIALAFLLGLAYLALLSTTVLPGPATPGLASTPSATSRPVTASAAPAVSPTANLFAARQLVNQVLANPADYQALWAAQSDGLRRSNDGGKTWAEVADFKGRNVTALAFDPDENGALYAATDRAGLFKTADGGKTWKNIGLTDRPLTALTVAKFNLYVSVLSPRPTVYHSSDGGQNWTAPGPNNLPPGLDIRSMAIDSLNPQNVYIGTAYVAGERTPDWGRVKYSGDGGKTWRDAGQGWGVEGSEGPDARRPVTILVFAQPDRLYAGDGDRVWRLSPDRSAWLPVAGGLPTSGIYGLTTEPQAGIAGLVYAATRDGFYNSSDGQTWQKLATGETGSLFGAEALPTLITPLLTAGVTNRTANSTSGLHTTYLYALNAEGRLSGYENRDFRAELVAAVPGASNLPDFTPFGGINPAEKLPPPEGLPDPTKRYFAGWGHFIQGDFKQTWEATDRDGLALYGYPLTEQFREFDPRDGQTKTVQFFERVKFELSDMPNSPVRTALIGYEAIEGRYFAPGKFIPTTDVQQYFPQTKHTLKGAFFDFWKKNNSLQRFGYPISEEFTEKNAQGKEIIYQYFERAKFAFDTETKSVSIALLGNEVLQKRGWK